MVICLNECSMVTEISFTILLIYLWLLKPHCFVVQFVCRGKWCRVKAKVTLRHDRHLVLELPRVMVCCFLIHCRHSLVEFCYYLRNWRSVPRSIVSVAFCPFSSCTTVPPTIPTASHCWMFGSVWRSVVCSTRRCWHMHTTSPKCYQLTTALIACSPAGT